MKILDVGCGNGAFMKFLEQSGYANVYGVEPSEDLLRQIHEKDRSLGERVKKGFSTEVPFEDNSFDCIYFFNVLHHLRNTDDYCLTMKEVDRCLKPGGIAVLLEPCNEWVYSSKRSLARVLSPASSLFANIHQMMMEEKEPVTYFFRHHRAIKEKLAGLDYKILRDRKIIYQWILVARKAEK